MQSRLEELSHQLDLANVDARKFATGNKSAGTRLRLAMQEIKKLAQEVRELVSATNHASQ